MSDLEPSLQSALNQFNHWRASRAKRERMPGELKALLPPLLKIHSMGLLSKTLRVAHNTLKDIQRIHCPETARSKHPKAQKKSGIFTECTLPVLAATSTEGCRLEFNRPDGQSVKVSGLTLESLQTLVTLLLGA